jgi:hypothetical protein
MKMANERSEISSLLIAPCGINCWACYLHLRKTKPCEGCFAAGPSKPEHCQNCKIKDCLMDQDVVSCIECSSFPCELIEEFDKRYRRKFKKV